MENIVDREQALACNIHTLVQAQNLPHLSWKPNN